jgi:hypothetical protein
MKLTDEQKKTLKECDKSNYNVLCDTCVCSECVGNLVKTMVARKDVENWFKEQIKERDKHGLILGDPYKDGLKFLKGLE